METSSEPIIEIRNLVLGHVDHPERVEPSHLVIHRGDVVAIMPDNHLGGRHLLRVLATLDPPVDGDYYFKGNRVYPDRYMQCLAVKRQIGYVAADAAMISNRTLRENMLLTRFYHENNLRIDIDETVRCLFETAGLTAKLDQRPTGLSGTEILKAIAIREIAKVPAVMLIELPEHFLQMKPSDGLYQHLNKMNQSGLAVIFFSNHSKLIRLANRRLGLAGGTLRTISF